jgi:hypothetical protein
MIILTFNATGCKKYHMANVLGDEDVDITYWVKKLNYKPVYCGDEICALINPKPYNFNEIDLNLIRDFIVKNSNCKIDSIDINMIKSNMKYNESYFMTSFPVDIFSFDLNTLNLRIHMEIRVEKDIVILPSVDDAERMVVYQKSW